jgi:DNA-binding MarR family transcriptional regulator
LEFPSPRFKNDSAASTGLVFIRVYNKWHCIVQKELRKIGITHPQFVAMTVLNFLSQMNEFVTQASIARMADMDVMSVSQILRGLETGGYLTRTANPKDTRANAVRLLPKGRDAIKKALPIVERIDDEFFGVLLGEEDSFRNYLHKLV